MTQVHCRYGAQVTFDWLPDEDELPFTEYYGPGSEIEFSGSFVLIRDIADKIDGEPWPPFVHSHTNIKQIFVIPFDPNDSQHQEIRQQWQRSTQS